MIIYNMFILKLIKATQTLPYTSSLKAEDYGNT